MRPGILTGARPVPAAACSGATPLAGWGACGVVQPFHPASGVAPEDRHAAPPEFSRCRSCLQRNPRTVGRNGRRPRRFAVWWLLLAALLLAAPADGEPIPLPEGPIRGMTIGCFRWGPGEWDGPHMAATLDELKDLGVGWIALPPYASVFADGRIDPSVGTDASVLVPVALAKQRGMRTLLKPHLGYWRSRVFSWRGEIRFGDPAALDRFFAGYTAWIVHQAELAERSGVDLFCVGLEYAELEHLEDRWRAVIAAVREVYGGPVTYAANWDRIDEVPFWDALDAVGVQAYFPLVAEGNGDPSDADLRAGWERIRAELRGVAERTGRPVLLTELGYPRSTNAAVEPWVSGDEPWLLDPNPDPVPGDDEAGARLKARCLAVALEAVAAEPAVRGVFLWKWFPTPRRLDSEFHLQNPPTTAVVDDAWGGKPSPRPLHRPAMRVGEENR